ncbi:MAG: ATP-binding protein [Proteobacteria bacterium]|nr:ATP-binding protein [Pseudomonadota bacterium]MBU4298161.1 ATP-binding protein [Pseudomonadota bacterium]MCG2748363.1 ATP-binding protein [Desulfobulbaceae bacterium]
MLLLSGKGGTGKTSITGALAALMTNKVMADCDVDAADLHLILAPRLRQENEFGCGVEAEVDSALCNGCGTCVDLCHFHALVLDETARLLPFSCEGCGVCSYFCPEQAITLRDKLSGHWFIADTDYGPLVHARLGIGEENSGKLVSMVKRQARELAEAQQADWLLVDGPPGIGCPAIASMSGANYVLLITEPTRSGLHDLLRVADLVRHFKIPCGVCINKWDLHPETSTMISQVCVEGGMELVGRIPFDTAVSESIVRGVPLLCYKPASPAASAVRAVWQSLQRVISG